MDIGLTYLVDEGRKAAEKIGKAAESFRWLCDATKDLVLEAKGLLEEIRKQRIDG